MKKGFTLLELIIVIIIIGVLASLAIPQLFRSVERSRAVEGTSIIGVMRASQIREFAETGSYGVVDDLDIDFTTPQFFATSTGSKDSTQLATARRITTNNLPAGWDGYTLSISEIGNITCANVGAHDDCTDIGY